MSIFQKVKKNVGSLMLIIVFSKLIGMFRDVVLYYYVNIEQMDIFLKHKLKKVFLMLNNLQSLLKKLKLL